MPSIDSLRVKWSYVTRRLPLASYHLVPQDSASAPGDFVVARVCELGSHNHLEDVHGRRARLYPGDLVVGALGNRYATDAFEGFVPDGPTTDLLTAGGLIGTVATAHDALPTPSRLEVLGRVALDGSPVTTGDCAIESPPEVGASATTVLVVGSSMNAGKTTTVTSLVRGYLGSGLRVGAGKVTGSGSGKDRWAYVDAGADEVLDFLDFGMPSTFGYPIERLTATMRSIHRGLAASCDVVILEIADGVLQAETATLLREAKGLADGVVVAVADPLAAKAAVEVVAAESLPLACVSGLITRSPLAVREAERVIGVPVLGTRALAAGAAVPLVQALVARC